MIPIRAPFPLPLPVGAQTIAAGASVTLQPTGSPLYLEMIVVAKWYQWFGVTVSFASSSPAPHNLGIYGPNPTSIGPPFGRMRAPNLGLPDGTSNTCTGNFKNGTYYLVLRSGDNGAPSAPITVTVK